MRILVTGSSGFIGRNLMPLLERGPESRYSAVFKWHRSRDGDLLVSDDRERVLDRVRPDAVVHLAWLQTGVAGYEHDPRNRLWGEASMQFAQQVIGMGSRFLGLGSLIENDDTAQSAYAVSKREAGAGVLAAGAQTGLTTWLRPSWIFDFGEHRPRVLQEHASARAKGETFVPTHQAKQLDFIHVLDVAEGIRYVLDSSMSGRWDIASSRQMSVATFLGCFDEWSRLGRPTLGNPAGERPDRRHTSHADANNFKVGWEPRETERALGRFWP